MLDANDFFDVVPDLYTFYGYPGSLTTPGCDEIVNWYLSRYIIPINSKQLKFFQTSCNEESCENNRKV